MAMKYTIAFLMCLAGAQAAALPAGSEQPVARENPHHADGLKVVQYDGPRYKMTEDDLAGVRESWRTGASWEKPAGMPVIEVETGTILDFGGNSTLPKRSGQHLIGACSGSDCTGTTITQVKDFGCGTGCITMSQTAWSGFVFQEYHGNPYPTMDVWSGYACTGNKKHFGVVDTYSCTNADSSGFKSFIGYFDC